MTLDELSECVLCHERGPGSVVAMGLVWWRAGGIDAWPRCRDRIACRRRLEERGETWPVLDNGAPSKSAAR